MTCHVPARSNALYDRYAPEHAAHERPLTSTNSLLKRLPEWQEREISANQRCPRATRPDACPAFLLVTDYLVGLGGLEPPASSLSAKYREPLCGRPFSQVTLDRRGRS